MPGSAVRGPTPHDLGVRGGHDADLQPVADAFATKYGTDIWHFVVRDGGFAHHDAGGRALVFHVRPVRGLGFCKGAISSQTTWRFPG